MNLPTPQCNSGITQSRPFPARAVKVMESAGAPIEAMVANAARARTEDESPGLAEVRDRLERQAQFSSGTGMACNHSGRCRSLEGAGKVEVMHCEDALFGSKGRVLTAIPPEHRFASTQFASAESLTTSGRRVAIRRLI